MLGYDLEVSEKKWRGVSHVVMAKVLHYGLEVSEKSAGEFTCRNG